MTAASTPSRCRIAATRSRMLGMPTPRKVERKLTGEWVEVKRGHRVEFDRVGVYPRDRPQCDTPTHRHAADPTAAHRRRGPRDRRRRLWRSDAPKSYDTESLALLLGPRADGCAGRDVDAVQHAHRADPRRYVV